MNEKKLKLSLLCVVLLVFNFSVAAFGDWNPGDPNKMHYPQLPNPDGWDVAFYSDINGVPLELADDWKCAETGPVSDIHFWVSWRGDDVLPIQLIRAKIYSNNPVGPSGWSEPNQLFWSGDFPAGEFTERPYGTGVQGWCDPVEPEWFYDDHLQYFQINITDIDDPFVQQEGEIYWLSLEVITETGGRVGWKTAIPPYFMDDAVWREPGGPWIELRDPTGMSLDFSFVITGEEEPNFAKPLEPHTKWSQPPIEIDPCSAIPTYCGWDEESHNMVEPGTPLMQIVADDFRCIGPMPVTSIHWWASFVGWEWPWAHGILPPVLPEKWWIGFWSNVPANAPPYNLPYSSPEVLLHSITIPANRVTFEEVGWDEYYGYYDNDICYQYNVNLNPEEVFWQNDFNDMTHDNIYWISIVAEYNDLVDPEYKWGWKTRPWHWMDDAVTFNLTFEPLPGFVLDPCGVNPIVDPRWQESFDVAFELDTDPNYIKWEQLYAGIRHWPHYEDEKSMATVERWTEVDLKWIQQPDLNPAGIDVDATMELTGNPLWPPQILADDFLCTSTGPITDISIWGSWFNDEMPMNDPMAVEFTLSIYSDNPTGPSGFSEPDALLWRMDFPAGAFMVELAGTEPEGYYTPCVPEYYPQNHLNAWKYSFRIDPAQAFNQQGDPCAPVIYWLAVQARPLPDGTFRFGWKTSIVQWNDDAVWAIGEYDPFQPWEELRHPETGISLDLAFEITTSEEKEEFVLHRMVADDWRCERRTPVMAVVWWGSYIGYGYKACSQGPFMPLPVKPDYFELNIWTDVAAGEDPCVPFSHPNEIIWGYKSHDYDEVLVGYDKHPHGEPNEPVFRYSVRLPEDMWFHQPDFNEVFWLSIVAVYDVNTPNYDWGWTNHKHVFNDDAVGGYKEAASGRWVWAELFDQTGASEDMSFMLFTDPSVCSTCANYNCDALVNFFDYADFADDWLWTGLAGGYNNSDLNCDGGVDLYDVKMFADQWLTSCP
jgi:hypothetical protein